VETGLDAIKVLSNHLTVVGWDRIGVEDVAQPVDPLQTFGDAVVHAGVLACVAVGGGGRPGAARGHLGTVGGGVSHSRLPVLYGGHGRLESLYSPAAAFPDVGSLVLGGGDTTVVLVVAVAIGLGDALKRVVFLGGNGAVRALALLRGGGRRVRRVRTTVGD